MSGLINPPSPSNLKFDASDNVLANINAQNINPNSTSLNPYVPILASQQTGLSATATAANTFYNIGSSFTISRTGLLNIGVWGHVNGGNGAIALQITRGSTVIVYGTSSVSLFVTLNSVAILNTGIAPLFVDSSSVILTTYIIPVLSGDIIQFQIANNTAGDIVYIDSLLAILQ